MSENVTETDDFVHIETDEGVLTMLKEDEAFLQLQYHLDWGVRVLDDVTIGDEVSEWAFLDQTVLVDVGSPHTQADVVVDGEVAYTEVADSDGVIQINTNAEGVGDYEIVVDTTTVESFTVADIQEFDKEEVSDEVKKAIGKSVSDELNLEEFSSSEVHTAYFNDDDLPQHMKSHINDMLLLEPNKTDMVDFEV